jgi:glycosyltransferase involved in cell wall biosynthesis
MTTPDTPHVSLIVCTRNRASRLAVCLEHLARLQAPPGGWELVLVDNGSRDETGKRITEFARQVDFSVIHVHEPRPGLGRARNTGVARARGDILVFTDDDCYAQPDYLIQMCRVFDESRPGYAGGRITRHDPTDDPATTKDVPTAEEFPPHAFVPAGAIHGANMALRREVIEAVGGFDPLLGAGAPLRAGEDLDLLSRASWAGWAGVYDPRPVVAHHHGRKPGKDVARVKRAYDQGCGACFAKALLDPRRRSVYLRRWLWTIRYRLRRGMVAQPAREVAGAVRYLAHRCLGAGTP